RRKWRSCHAVERWPVVMEVKSRAVIDKVERFVPQQQIRIVGGPVNVRYKGIEPHSAGGEIGIGAVMGRWIEHHRARQVIERKIQPDAGAQQISYLFVGFVAAESGIELNEDDLRHFQAESATDLAG